MSLVDEIFNRVWFDETDKGIHKAAYDAVKQIANVMDEAAPNCAEKTLALRSLHLACMHFGTALAKHPKYKREGQEDHTLTVDEMPPGPPSQ